MCGLPGLFVSVAGSRRGIANKLPHCFADLPGSPCASGAQAQARLPLSACWPPTIAFCFPHSDQGLPLLRGTWKRCPQASVFFPREADSGSIPFPPWEGSLRSFQLMGLQGEDLSKSFWSSAKALKTSPNPNFGLGKLPTEGSVKVGIFSVAQMEES